MKTKMKIITGNNAIHGLFNADSLHNMMYTIIMLSKYKNLGVPFQYYFDDKYINDKLKQYNNNLYNEPHEIVISDLVRIYSDYFYEILPYLVIWRDSNKHYINDELPYHLNKCLVSKNIRFVLLKLTIIITPNSTHANIILYDKIKNTLERFEPYGAIPYLESDKLDEFIEKFGKTHINKNLKYLKPKDIFGTLGFQTISNDSKQEVKKLSDPQGYCLAWTFWYLEMRLNNPDIYPTEMIKQTTKSILDNNNIEGDRLFISFIRNYAFDLDTQKNQFMKNAGIGINDIYNLALSPQDQRTLTVYMTNTLNNIITERY